MKKNFKSTIKCLLVSLCLAGVGAFMFASMGYADVGTIKSIEDNTYNNTWHYYNWSDNPGEENHRSRGYNSGTATPLYADHATTEWQELGYNPGYGDIVNDLGDYGVSWSTDGGNTWGNDNLYVSVGETVKFKFNMHSENVGNHYANILKGWIDWNTDASNYEFDNNNDVVSGFKMVRDSNGSVSSDYTFDSGHDTLGEDDYGDKYSNRNDMGYGNDNETFTYSHVISESDFGTAYLRARVTCTHSILSSSNWNGGQWDYVADDYLNAFSAYADYYQGEIEDWMFTVSETPPPGSAVPEPTTLALFGMGLIGLARVGRKKA